MCVLLLLRRVRCHIHWSCLLLLLGTLLCTYLLLMILCLESWLLLLLLHLLLKLLLLLLQLSMLLLSRGTDRCRELVLQLLLQELLLLLSVQLLGRLLLHQPLVLRCLLLLEQLCRLMNPQTLPLLLCLGSLLLLLLL